jgi:hypothetical protein
MSPSGDQAPLQGGVARIAASACTAGILAGVASLFVGEAVSNRYRDDLRAPMSISPTPQEMRRWKDARLYSATLTFTAMGGMLGLAMGAAGGAARRSVWAGAGAAAVGILLGTIAAGGLSLLLVPVFFNKYDPQSGDLALPLLTHGAIWSAVGSVGGLAFGLGLGGRNRWPTAFLGGLLGAAVATVVYEVIGAVAFPSDHTDFPLASAVPARGMAQLLVAVFSAVGAAFALRQSATR